jgi:hypothetical protein
LARFFDTGQEGATHIEQPPPNKNPLPITSLLALWEGPWMYQGSDQQGGCAVRLQFKGRGDADDDRVVTTLAADSSGAGWRRWLLRSATARRIGLLVVIATATGGLVAAAVAVAALARQQPAQGLGITSVFAVPVLFTGQVWMIGWMMLRQPPASGKRRFASFGHSAWTPRPKPMTFFFGPINPRVGRVRLASAFLGWLLAMSAIGNIGHGGPAGSGHGCPYLLDDHGSNTCVSKEAYEHAGAGVQRFTAGILLGFFSIQTGAALGGRVLQDTPPTLP